MSPAGKPTRFNPAFGQILRAKIDFPETDTRRNKFLIMLGEDEDSRLFFLTTSKIDKLPTTTIANTNVIQINPGEVECFSLQTAIDCRSVHARPASWFDERIAKNTLGFHGELPQEYKDKIKMVAFNSPLISLRHRDIIMKAA